MENEIIPPSRQALEEALTLSEEILRNIELSEFPLANIALKSSRLARLLNEYDYQKIMEYEASGYPSTPDGVPPEAWKLALIADRGYSERNKQSKEIQEYVYTTSIEELEHETRIADKALESAKDADVSVSSANPHQYVSAPTGNHLERSGIRDRASRSQKRLSARRSLIHKYALQKHYELKYSGIADDIFSRARERVNSLIGQVVPESIQILTAVHENLQSENPEDWSNAVHSCRRILQDLADAIYPACDDKVMEVNGKEKTIKLGNDNYINRLIAYVEETSQSNRFNDLVGSHLGFIGDRLDSVFKAAQKGSHDKIVSREEADRYVVYTYLISGDILSLRQ